MDTSDITKSLGSKSEIVYLGRKNWDMWVLTSAKTFCVDRRTLSRRSNFFERKLAKVLENNPEGRSRHATTADYKSFAVIDVTDKCPKDIEFLLLAIFKEDHYKPPPKMYPYHTTATILRLGEEYDAPTLIQRALANLVTLFPLDQNALDEIAGANKKPDLSLSDSLDLLTMVDRIPHMKWLIPSIVYLALNLPDVLTLTSLVRRAPGFREMIIECWTINGKRLGITKPRRDPIDKDGTDSSSGVKDGTAIWNECLEYLREFVECSRKDLWNEHVRSCRFKDWNQVEELRKSALEAYHCGPLSLLPLNNQDMSGKSSNPLLD